jgi:hypothetical protein
MPENNWIASLENRSWTKMNSSHTPKEEEHLFIDND